jgi:predicted phage-related endonuclease
MRVDSQEEFRVERRKGIGGSDWGQTTELGDRCTRALVLEKRGIPQDYPDDAQKLRYFKRGHVMEPIICKLAEEELEIDLRQPGKRPKTGLPDWWVGNPDRLIVRGGIFEAKSKGPFPFKKFQTSGPPIGEVLQCIHYNALYRRESAILYAHEPVMWQTDHAVIEKDESLINDMIILGERIWKMVTDGPLPERLDAASKQCQSCPWRWSCQGEALYSAAEIDQSSEDAIEVEEGDLLAYQAEILEIKELKKELTEREAEINDQAKKLIGAPGKLLVAGRAVHWLQYEETRFDAKNFRAENPKLAEKYLKKSTKQSMRWY